MFQLTCRAYLQLIRMDLFLARGEFARMYEHVRRVPLLERCVSANDPGRVCLAIDLASVWYWKQVLCLQRSAAAACLLKSYGVPAQMVIGVQRLPFKAHAWVEVDGRVVNDKPYTPEMYTVLDRC